MFFTDISAFDSNAVEGEECVNTEDNAEAANDAECEVNLREMGRLRIADMPGDLSGAIR